MLGSHTVPNTCSALLFGKGKKTCVGYVDAVNIDFYNENRHLIRDVVKFLAETKNIVRITLLENEKTEGNTVEAVKIFSKLNYFIFVYFDPTNIILIKYIKKTFVGVT